MSNQNLVACLCGSIESSIGYESPQAYWVECSDCGYKTYDCSNRTAALYAWIQRNKPTEAKAMTAKSNRVAGDMVSVPRELVERIADHCKFWKDHTYLEAISNIEDPLRTLLAPPAEDVRAMVDEPVAWQFYQDGKWWNGDDRIKDHRHNTERAGYLTRELYAHAQRKTVMPEPRKEWGSSEKLDLGNLGWNACLDEFKRLNPELIYSTQHLGYGEES